MITWKRVVRTATSERFLASRDAAEVAAVDLHYLPGGTAAGTVILLKSAGLTETDIQSLLSSFDQDFLPDFDLANGTLTYTVVTGEIVGNYEATPDSNHVKPK
jgi:hypothetical protein